MDRVLALSIAGWMSCATAVIQGAQAPAPQGGRISACSLMPRALMEKVTPGPVNKIVFEIKATEDAIGAHGSGCGYAGTELQIDPFARPDDIRKDLPAKGWQPVSGVGDAAFFHNNSDRYAELAVWTGTHHLTIQMSVPDGKTAEAVKANTVMLAKAIIPKLR